uniref:Uncharacterized protein n=1 Tax=Amphimedon queenslandica TaxID=400682 RepID=A0A1X7SU16_AMPQE
MSPSLFLVCLFLIAACTEGAVIDKEKGMNDTALLQLLPHINKRHNIPLERRETCTLSSDCTPSNFLFGRYSISSVLSNSDLRSLNDEYSRLCTSGCAGAISEYLRCLYSEHETGEYIDDFVKKYLCGQEREDYCPVRILRSFNTTSNAIAYYSIINYCTTSSISARLISCTDTDDCIDGLRNFTSAAGCCMEPLFGSGVRSCSEVSVPDACNGSATGIIATPIVAISLMIFALAGVFL